MFCDCSNSDQGFVSFVCLLFCRFYLFFFSFLKDLLDLDFGLIVHIEGWQVLLSGIVPTNTCIM